MTTGPLITLLLNGTGSPTGPRFPYGSWSVDAPAPGRQGGARWTFDDGVEGIAYARNLTEPDLIAVLKALYRDAGPAAGFRLNPQPEPYVLVTIDSRAPAATVASSRCERAGAEPILVTAVTGPVPGVYAVLATQTPAAASVAVLGDSMLFLSSTDPATGQAALASLDNVPPAEWTRYAEPQAPSAPAPTLAPSPA